MKFLSRRLPAFLKVFGLVVSGGGPLAIMYILAKEGNIPIRDLLILESIIFLFGALLVYVLVYIDKTVYFDLENLTIISRGMITTVPLQNIDSVFQTQSLGWITYTMNDKTKTIVFRLMAIGAFNTEMPQLKSSVARAKGIEYRNRMSAEGN